MMTIHKAYDVSPVIAEIYDQTEVQTEDLHLLRRLLAPMGKQQILEPFCGNGRLVIPLAEDGHTMTGIDRSAYMLASAQCKLRALSGEVQSRVHLLEADVLEYPWPQPFDLVILGANCLYELSTASAQEQCIRLARESLRPGGFLWLDNDHMEGDLDPSWCEGGVQYQRFPTGVTQDGTRVEGTMETIWYDKPQRLVRFRRTVSMTSPAGESGHVAWIEQKHPPSTAEMRGWLTKYGFDILNIWGDRNQAPYTDESRRAVFWAQLP